VIKHDHSNDKLNNPDQSGSDTFDHFLMKQLQQNQTYIADDNFTAQVMGGLPAPKKLSRWQERLIIIVPLLVISALVLSQFSILAMLIKLWTFAVSVNFTQLIQIGVAVSVLVVGGASIWFARQLKLI